MASPLMKRPLNAVILTAFLFVLSTFAQNCYYPNGIVDASQSACFPGNDAGACCPQGWECLSNGLCFNSGANYYGRYGCTDQTWNASTCPQICADANGYAGNEAVMLCDDGSYCCDADRQHGNCCTNQGTDFFSLPSGSQVAYVSSLQPTTAAPSGGSNVLPTTSEGVPTTPGGSQQSSSASSGSPSSGSGSSGAVSVADAATTGSASPSGQSDSSPSSGHSSTFSQVMATTTAPNGSPSTVYLVSTIAATPTADPSSGQNHKSSNLPLIIGLAAGIPAFLLLLAGILACLFLRRRRSRRRDAQTLSGIYGKDKPKNPEMTDLRPAHGATRPELDSYPIAPTRNKSNRQSELEGSSPIMNRHLLSGSAQNSPAMSGAAPPQYSPLSPTNGGGHLSQVREEEPQELWGGYVPYRIPRAEMGSGVPSDGESDVEKAKSDAGT